MTKRLAATLGARVDQNDIKSHSAVSNLLPDKRLERVVSICQKNSDHFMQEATLAVLQKHLVKLRVHL